MKRSFKILILLLPLFIYGLIFSLIVPPGQAPDEPLHFVRAYEIAKGKIVPQQKITLAGKFFDLIFYNQNTYLKDLLIKNDSSIPPGTLPNYPHGPIAYLPQSIGIALGLFLKANAAWIFLLGRLASFITYFVTVYIILLRSRFFWTSFVIFTMPMSLYLAASFSVDSMLFILSFLYIHLILSNLGYQTKLDKKELVAIFTTGTLLVFAKQIGVILILLTFLIPISRFGNLRNKLILIASQFIVVGLLSIQWLALTAPVFMPPPDASPMSQILYIFSHPFLFLQQVLITTLSNYRFYLATMVAYFGWITIPVPIWVYVIFAIIVILGILIDSQEQDNLLSFQSRFFLLGTFLAYYLLVQASLYVLWTPYQANTIIQGIQGRYFIPALPMAIYSIASKRLFFIPYQILFPMKIITTVLAYLLLGISTYTIYIYFAK